MEHLNKLNQSINPDANSTEVTSQVLIIIIIIMAGMAIFNVAGYLIEERRRWPVMIASPRG